MTLRTGHLFAGYDGLGMAVEAVWPDSEIAWFSDVCKFNKDGTVGHHEPHRAPCSILAHHYPDVPNLGDVAAVDWSQVEPVDILTGGSPCQDLSHAGKRAGMTEGTRSNLWVAMREAIAQLRPGLVIWENVRGAYSAAADSDMEPCSGCLGDGPDEPALRALGRVLGDLSELGYDAAWHGLRAADIGAPHGRFRVFVAATPQDAGVIGEGEWAPGEVLERRAESAVRPVGSGLRGLLPTTTATDRGDARAHKGGNPTLAGAVLGYRDGDVERRHSLTDYGRRSLAANSSLLPTPAVNDMGASYTPDGWDDWTDRMKAEHGNGNGHGKSLSIEAQRLLLEERSTRWGRYGPAVHQWESITRRAPDATEPGPDGSPRLSPAFSEWMMGLPAGHVTDVPGITRNEALKALGNGVVPRQAAAAIRFLLSLIRQAAA